MAYFGIFGREHRVTNISCEAAIDGVAGQNVHFVNEVARLSRLGRRGEVGGVTSHTPHQPWNHCETNFINSMLSGTRVI
jgi:hypothetical protein